MAKTKLKSVFTREDVYTILQLLKALADSVDDNEAITDEDIKKLQEKVLKSVEVVSAGAGLNKIILTFMDGQTLESAPYSMGSSLGPTTVHGSFQVTDGNATFGGNAEIDGNVNVNSSLVTETIKSGSFLMPKATEEQIDRDLPLVPKKTGEMATNGTISVNYSHVRNSNGKLSIVVLVSYKCNTDFTKTTNEVLFNSFNIFLPASIMSKIFPIESGTATYRTVLTNRITSFAVNTATGIFELNVPNPVVIFTLGKDNAGSNILLDANIYYNAGAFKAGKTYAWRFEANLML